MEKEKESPENNCSEQPKFENIDENRLLCSEAFERDCRDFDCDCNPSKRDKKEGRACGSDCINRILLMECWGRCVSGKYCTNRRFQNKEYANLELFFTGPKGWGLRAQSEIKKGDFIIEYVGEVVNIREMSKRIHRYGKDPAHKHHYLMALNSNCVIDATVSGNLSRFINHSCDPNAITEKWTVGNEIRIGFFAKRTIHPDEEICFDYKFERYGRQAQACYCGAHNCTGYIGSKEGFSDDDEPDENQSQYSDSAFTDDENSALPIFSRKLPPSEHKKKLFSLGKKHSTPRKKKSDAELKLETETKEIDALASKGTLRNRDQVLEFNRLLVRLDMPESRKRMVDLLMDVDDNDHILRLFVLNHGLRLMQMWFHSPDFTLQSIRMQASIAKLLFRLPVKYKNQINETQIMQTIEQILEMEPPIKLVVNDVVQSVVDSVSLSLESNNEIMIRKEHPLLIELESLKCHTQRLANKWAELIEYHYRIPKKKVQHKANDTSESPSNPWDDDLKPWPEKTFSSHPFGHPSTLNGFRSRFTHYENIRFARGRGAYRPGFFRGGFGHTDRRFQRPRFFHPRAYYGSHKHHSYENGRSDLNENDSSQQDQKDQGRNSNYNNDAPPPPPAGRPHPLMHLRPSRFDRFYPHTHHGLPFSPKIRALNDPTSPFRGIPMPAPPPSTTMVNVLERLEVLKQVAEKSNAKLMLSKNDSLGKDGYKETKNHENDGHERRYNSQKKNFRNKYPRQGRYMSRAAINRMMREKYLAKIQPSPSKCLEEGSHVRKEKEKSRTLSPPSRPSTSTRSASNDKIHDKSERRRSKDGPSRNSHYSKVSPMKESHKDKGRPFSLGSERPPRSHKRHFTVSPARDGWESIYGNKPANSIRGGRLGRRGRGENRGGRWRMEEEGKHGGRGSYDMHQSHRNGPLPHQHNHDGRRHGRSTGVKNKNDKKATEKRRHEKNSSDSSSSSDSSRAHTHRKSNKSKNHHRTTAARSSSSSSTSSSSSESSSTNSSNTGSTSTSTSISSVEKKTKNTCNKQHLAHGTRKEKEDSPSAAIIVLNTKKHEAKKIDLHPVESNAQAQKDLNSKNDDVSEMKLEHSSTSKLQPIIDRPPVPSFLKKSNESEDSVIKLLDRLTNVKSHQPGSPSLTKGSSQLSEPINDYDPSKDETPFFNLSKVTVDTLYDPAKLGKYISKTKKFLHHLEAIQKSLHPQYEHNSANDSPLMFNSPLIPGNRPCDSISHFVNSFTPATKREVQHIASSSFADDGPPNKRLKTEPEVIAALTPPEDPRSVNPNRSLKTTDSNPKAGESPLLNRRKVIPKSFDSLPTSAPSSNLTQAHQRVALDLTVLHHTSEQIGDATSTTMQNLVAPSSEPELLTASTEIGQNHVESDAVLSHLTQVAIPSSEQSQAIHAQADQCNAPIMVSDIKQEPMEFYPQASMNGEIPKLVSKSGNWFQTVDSLGQIYYYHRETRESVWEPPEDEEFDIDAQQDDKTKIVKVATRERRAEFKQKVYEQASTLIEPYRKRFFNGHSEYQNFVRKIIHIVLDSQDKNGNYALDFDDSVNKATKRLVDQYIQQFKASHSKSIMTPSKEISHTRKQDKLPHPDAIRTALKDLASSSSTAR